MKQLALAITVLVSLLAGSFSVIVASWTSATAALPYPQSKLVTALAWDSAVVRIGDGTTGEPSRVSARTVALPMKHPALT